MSENQIEPSKPKGRVLAPSVHVWADTSALPEFRIDTGGGGGGERFGAVCVSEESLDFVSIGAALQSRFIPAGPLLTEVQGQQTLATAKRQAAKLAYSMRHDGRGMSDTSQADAGGAGAAAVVQWRNGADLYGADIGAACVYWRAVVKSVASDWFGESIEDWRESSGGADGFDLLTGSAMPLPALMGDGSRSERAARLLFERARAKRPALLARRIESLKARGGRGRRGELLDKLHRAAVLLLHGEPVDTAASLAGFKASGASRAGDYLMRAARRLGFQVQFPVRDRQSRAGEAGGGGVCLPLSAAVVSAWSFHPSASLPLQDGRGGKRWGPIIQRLQGARVRRQAQAAKRAAWARADKLQAAKRLGKHTDKGRAARRAAKQQGLWAGLLTSGNLPRYGHGKHTDKGRAARRAAKQQGLWAGLLTSGNLP